MLKFILEVAAGNLLSEALTAPSAQQISTEERRKQWETDIYFLRLRYENMIADILKGKDYTPEQIMQIRGPTDDQFSKAIEASRLELFGGAAYVAPASTNAATLVDRFIVGAVIGGAAFLVLLAIVGLVH